MNTIDDVLREMDRIVEICSRGNLRAGYFAVLYRQVTRRIKAGIENGEFEDADRMERLDVLFAKRYIDAFHAYYDALPVTQSWEKTFRASEDSHHVILQYLLLGINTHINLDLGIAASKTMGEMGLAGIKEDFDRINSILESMVDDVKNNIGKVSPVFWLLIGLAKGRDEMLLAFSIEIARDGAWDFAGEYHLSASKQEILNQRDQKIARISERLVTPGKWLSFLLKLIRFGEYQSPASVMMKMDDQYPG